MFSSSEQKVPLLLKLVVNKGFCTSVGSLICLESKYLQRQKSLGSLTSRQVQKKLPLLVAETPQHALHGKDLQTNRRRYTGQQLATKSICGPCDKPQVNRTFCYLSGLHTFPVFVLVKRILKKVFTVPWMEGLSKATGKLAPYSA